MRFEGFALVQNGASFLVADIRRNAIIGRVVRDGRLWKAVDQDQRIVLVNSSKESCGRHLLTMATSSPN